MRPPVVSLWSFYFKKLEKVNKQKHNECRYNNIVHKASESYLVIHNFLEPKFLLKLKVAINKDLFIYCRGVLEPGNKQPEVE